MMADRVKINISYIILKQGLTNGEVKGIWALVLNFLYVIVTLLKIDALNDTDHHQVIIVVVY